MRSGLGRWMIWANVPPYVLFVRGATSFLARPMQDLVTVTGSRAASAYGEHVAGELAGDLANRERVLVAGGA